MVPRSRRQTFCRRCNTPEDIALPTSDAQRPTPYANFRFRVGWNGTYVLGVSKVSALRSSDELLPDMRPRETATQPITLAHGVSYDIEFAQWANMVFDYTNSGASPPSRLDFRRDLAIDLYNEAGIKVMGYRVHRAWPSAFSATPDLDGVGNVLVVQSLVVQHEGWERDTSIVDI